MNSFFGAALLVAVLALSPWSALAAQNVSVTVDGSTYSCTPGGGGADCAGAVDALRANLKFCLDNYNGYSERTGQCIPPEWRAFKENNSKSCAYQGSAACFELCVRYYTGYSEKTGICKQTCQL